jgi:hypothetical protein
MLHPIGYFGLNVYFLEVIPLLSLWDTLVFCSGESNDEPSPCGT